MRRCLTPVFHALAAILPGAALAAPASPSQDDLDFFETHIRPVLVESCYDCHSVESGKSKGGLLLDSRDGWMIGGDHGPSIVPGNPAASLLIEAIRHEDPDLEMPPKGPLTAEVVANFEEWIRRGAVDPRKSEVEITKETIDVEAGRAFWSWKPVESHEPPRLGPLADFVQTRVDAFWLAKLEEKGLEPAPVADPHTLVRRLHYDLTGLPPTPAQAKSFVQGMATDPEATLEKTADQLLASRAFAEKWARHWLDLARYADTNGSSFNPPFRTAWRYRNWVIDAIYQNMPIDDFIAKQIAGDLLPWETVEERDANLIATGYLMLGSKVLGLFDKETLTMDVVDEQLDTIGRGLLGVTMGCVRCHDHKFDPVSAKDYYALAGIFTSTVTLQDRFGRSDDESDWSRRGLGGVEADRKLQAFLEENRYAWIKTGQRLYNAEKEVENLERRLQRNASAERIDDLRDELAEARRELEKHQTKLASLEAEMPDFAMAVQDVSQPEDTTLRIRGEASSHGELVPRGFIQVASWTGQPAVDPSQSGRLQFAQWLTAPENPRTGRIFVNRVWQHLFREGLVRTVDDFGTRGDTPSHPSLLDDLAHRFTTSGDWDMKALVRELVLSRAYRSAVDHSPEAYAADPQNRLLWRQNRRRLEPEEIRDALLQFAGRLDPSPRTSVVEHIAYKDINGGDQRQIDVWDHRRTIYQPIVRTMVTDILEVFDFANPSVITGKRSDTTVAPQALYLMNSPFVRDTADDIARELVASTRSRDVDVIVEAAFERILNRPPAPSEKLMLGQYLTEQFEGPPGPTDHDIGKLCQGLLASTLFQFID